MTAVKARRGRPPSAQMTNDPRPAPRRYVVTTDRRPFWDGRRREPGEVIEDPAGHPAIEIMLDRGWIQREG